MDRFQEEVSRLKLTQLWADPWWQGRDFQLCGRRKGLVAKRFILSVDKGLGKTSTVLSIFEDPEVHKNEPNFTVIVLVSEKGMIAYTRDIQLFPEHANKVLLLKGSKVVRKNLWKNIPKGVRYIVVTYPAFLSDCGYRMNSKKKAEAAESIVPQWIWKNGADGFVLDEFHRQMRNRKSAFFQLMLDLTRYTEYLILMSGSAVSKGPEDIWAALHLLDRKFWSTYWGYVKTWCEVVGEGAYQKVFGPKRDPNTGRPDMVRIERWRFAVGPWVFHVTAEDVKDELPPISNQPLDIEMETWQRELHDSLLEKMYAETPDGDFIFSQNKLVNLFKIRTALICPKALNPEYGVGAGIEAIVDDVEELDIDACPRYAIFTPFVAPLPYLEAYLLGRHHGVYRMQGGISLDEQQQRLADWRSHTARTGQRSTLLCTIKYSESWECPEAWLGYFLGYEFDHEDNDQARKRLRRLISPRPVFIKWARHLGAYDMPAFAYLMEKKEGKDAMFEDWNRRTAQPSPH